jgi:hypothetical protein
MCLQGLACDDFAGMQHKWLVADSVRYCSERGPKKQYVLRRKNGRWKELCECHLTDHRLCADVWAQSVEEE